MIKNFFHLSFNTVGPSGRFPLLAQEGFEIKTGFQNIIGVESVKVDADEEMISLGSTERNCLFPEENQFMKIHKNYSYNNCMFECSFIYAQEIVKQKFNITCQPWFYPSMHNATTICDPWQSFEFNNIMTNNIPDDYCSQCLPDCGGISYESINTILPLKKCDFTNLGRTKFCSYTSKKYWPMSSKIALQILSEFNGVNHDQPWNIPYYMYHLKKISTRTAAEGLNNGDIFKSNALTYDVFDNDMAWVEIYNKKSTVLHIGSQLKMTWIDYFATVGGLLGLVLGMGIVSFVELAWLCLRIAARKFNFTHVVA